MEILKGLLGKGFFPVQLPPGFNSDSFATALAKYSTNWDVHKSPKTLLEKYSVARSSYYRRPVRIANPASYYYLASQIAEHWSKIERHYKRSKLSLSRPTVEPKLRAINISKFSELYEEKVKKSSGYRFVLITDVSSFFPSIYTHTIPWALHGKEVVKKERGEKYFGNILDSRCADIQDGQTIGLPIGPDTSHIVAEIIGVAIDLELKAMMKKWPSGFRYVDDYFLFFESREEAEKCLAQLAKCITNYELQMNPAKTRIVEVKELVEETWKYSLKSLTVSSQTRRQRNDIHNFFENLFSLEKRYSDESLIKYGLKQLSSVIIKKSNWQIYEAYLLKCGFSYPNTLQVICQILATYQCYQYPLNVEAIGRFCNTSIKSHAVADHHGEVSWLLWICKELSIVVKADAVRELQKMDNSVCTLIALDLHNSGLLAAAFKPAYLEKFARKEALLSTSWLLAFEGGRRNWLGNTNHSYIKQETHFTALLRHDVFFYNPDLKCSPIFTFKDEEHIDLGIFDSDAGIEENFDFDEMDEEYFDSSTASDSDEDDDEDIDLSDLDLI